ncbi:MAG: YciN family protein [Aeromonadaceae bacterium]
MVEKSPIQRSDLLKLANQMIREHEDYMEGMVADEVEQKGGILIFKGAFFLDDQGLPSPKTRAVFNMFKYLAQTLSGQYQLID